MASGPTHRLLLGPTGLVCRYVPDSEVGSVVGTDYRSGWAERPVASGPTGCVSSNLWLCLLLACCCCYIGGLLYNFNNLYFFRWWNESNIKYNTKFAWNLTAIKWFTHYLRHLLMILFQQSMIQSQILLNWYNFNRNFQFILKSPVLRAITRWAAAYLLVASHLSTSAGQFVAYLMLSDILATSTECRLLDILLSFGKLIRTSGCRNYGRHTYQKRADLQIGTACGTVKGKRIVRKKSCWLLSTVEFSKI